MRSTFTYFVVFDLFLRGEPLVTAFLISGELSEEECLLEEDEEYLLFGGEGVFFVAATATLFSPSTLSVVAWFLAGDTCAGTDSGAGAGTGTDTGAGTGAGLVGAGAVSVSNEFVSSSRSIISASKFSSCAKISSDAGSLSVASSDWFRSLAEDSVPF